VSQGTLRELLSAPVLAVMLRGRRLQSRPVRPSCSVGGRAAQRDAARPPSRAALVFVAAFCCLAPP